MRERKLGRARSWQAGLNDYGIRSACIHRSESGLEFLIAADIIDTLMRPNPQELLVLGAIVAIRTVISYSLNLELAQDAKHREKAVSV